MALVDMQVVTLAGSKYGEDEESKRDVKDEMEILEDRTGYTMVQVIPKGHRKPGSGLIS